jgi:hypothetical protein
MKQDYDRYEFLKTGKEYKMMPFVKIPKRNTDKYISWNSNTDRMDKLANKYYNNPFYNFFIIYANPEYISEYDIPDNTIIRIPYPLDVVKSYYESFLDKKFSNQ